MVGCLYSFFGAALAILMQGMSFGPIGLSVFFGATVLVVFGSGILTGPLVRRRGVVIALAAGAWLVLQAGGTTPAPFMAAVTLFLGGVGLVNPVATGLALESFGDRAGTASALLGFLLMTCAAVGTAMMGALPMAPDAAFAWLVLAGTALATAAFCLCFRKAVADPTG